MATGASAGGVRIAMRSSCSNLEADFTSASLAIDRHFAALPAVTDVVECRCKYVIANLAGGLPGQVQVEDDSSALILVAGNECITDLFARPVDDGGCLPSVRGKPQ